MIGDPGSFEYGVRFLRNLSEARGWSQARLAREADVDPALITRLFAGQQVGTLKSWIKICSALGVDSRLAFPADFPTPLLKQEVLA